MKAIFVCALAMLCSSMVYAGNCDLPSRHNRDFTASDVNCDSLTGKVIIENPKVIYYGQEQDMIIADRKNLIRFEFLYTADEMRHFCQQYGFNEYMDSTYTNLKPVGKGVYIKFGRYGEILDITELQKNPYRKVLSSLECR